MTVLEGQFQNQQSNQSNQEQQAPQPAPQPQQTPQPVIPQHPAAVNTNNVRAEFKASLAAGLAGKATFPAATTAVNDDELKAHGVTVEASHFKARGDIANANVLLGLPPPTRFEKAKAAVLDQPLTPGRAVIIGAVGYGLFKGGGWLWRKTPWGKKGETAPAVQVESAPMPVPQPMPVPKY